MCEVWDAVRWLSTLQVEVWWPVPICIELKKRTANKTVQLIGWVPAMLCKNIIILTATDFWQCSPLLGLFGLYIALLVLGCSLYCLCGIWIQHANMLITQIPCHINRKNEMEDQCWVGVWGQCWHGSPTTREEGNTGQKECVFFWAWIVTPSLSPFENGFLSCEHFLTFSFCIYSLR